jgi:hypothetical protein
MGRNPTSAEADTYLAIGRSEGMPAALSAIRLDRAVKARLRWLYRASYGNYQAPRAWFDGALARLRSGESFAAVTTSFHAMRGVLGRLSWSTAAFDTIVAPAFARTPTTPALEAVRSFPAREILAGARGVLPSDDGGFSRTDFPLATAEQIASKRQTIRSGITQADTLWRNFAATIRTEILEAPSGTEASPDTPATSGDGTDVATEAVGPDPTTEACCAEETATSVADLSISCGLQSSTAQHESAQSSTAHEGAQATESDSDHESGHGSEGDTGEHE